MATIFSKRFKNWEDYTNYKSKKKEPKYSKYLRSKYWKQFRAKVIKHYKHCYECKTTEKLHVHHKRYTRNNESILYHETLLDVMLLCETCHNKLHKSLKKHQSKKRIK